MKPKDRIKQAASAVAVLVFGLFVPILMITQAYLCVQAVNQTFDLKHAAPSPAQQIEQHSSQLRTGNDYVLFAALSIERSNEDITMHRQAMMAAIIQLGLAVISLGIMLLFLGIGDAGLDAIVDGAGFKFDFKTGSAGIAVFVVGALMSTTGAVLKGEFKTIDIPTFSSGIAEPSSGEKVISRQQVESAAEKIIAFCSTQPSELFGKCYQANLHEAMETAK